MNIAVQKQIPKNTFGLICTICEQDEPIISQRLFPYFKNRGSKKLLSLGVMEDAANSNTCPDYRGDDYAVTYKDNMPGFYKKDVWHEVSYDHIRMHRLNINSLVSVITKDLDAESAHEELIKDYFFRIGTLKINKRDVPIFFARRIQFQKILEEVYNAVTKRYGINKGIILTSSSYLPFGCSKLLGHEIISLKDCMIHDSENYHIDMNIIKASVEIDEQPNNSKINKEGFSTGYRSAHFNGEDFKFSKQEADVLELLDKAGKPMHKDEVTIEISDNIAELKFLFKSPDSKNIRKTILKYDNKGYYWLDY